MAHIPDEVVVTAQRRTESLMNVPLAITAIGGDNMAKMGITQPNALASVVPNLQVNDSTGGNEPNFTLRGVGLGNDYSANQASPVGVYIDDAYMAFRVMHGSAMFDLERVEVLRGPQGTLFGRNTTGGAINFIARKPTLSGEQGRIDVGYGNYNQVRADAAVEFTPVESVLGVRAAVSFDRRDGYIDNLFPGAKDVGSANNLRGRVTLRYAPSADVDVSLRAHITRSRHMQPGVTTIGTGPGGVNPFSGYARDGIGFFDTQSDDPHHNRIDAKGLALNSRFTLSDALSLQTLTSYTVGESLLGQDADGSPVKVAETIFGSRYKEFSQEVRLVFDSDRVKAQGGVYYGRDRVNIDNGYILFQFLTSDFGLPVDPTLTTGGATILQSYRQIRTSKAVFGQVDVEPADGLIVTAGLRYTRDTAKYRDGRSVVGDFDFNPIVQVIGEPGNPLSLSGNNSALTGRAAVSYKFADGKLLYASYSRGYRAGTFNGSGYLSPAQIAFVEPEKVNAYEAGLKGRFLDGALNLSFAAFYYDYKNQQIQDQVGPVAFLRNAGASILKGGEIEADVRISPWVRLSGSAGYTDSHYDKLVLQDTDLRGKKLPFAPRLTANVRLDVRIPDVAGGELKLSPAITHTSSQWFTPYNDALGNAPLREGSYTVFDATVEWERGPWGFRVWGKNLTQEKYYAYGTNLTGFGFYYYNPAQPRTFGASVSRSF